MWTKADLAHSVAQTITLAMRESSILYVVRDIASEQGSNGNGKADEKEKRVA
jgi:hypothetical protein